MPKDRIIVKADPPTEYATIGELSTADFSDILDTTLMVVQTNTGSQNISISQLLKAFSNVDQEINGEHRNLYQETYPIGAIIPFLGIDPLLPNNQRNLGNFLPLNGQNILESTYPILFKVMGIEGAGNFDLPNINGFGGAGVNGSGYFLRGVNGDSRLPNTLQEDTLQNITGNFSSGERSTAVETALGAFRSSNNSGKRYTGEDSGTSFRSTTFDASRVARTSEETRSRNLGVFYYLKVDNLF